MIDFNQPKRNTIFEGVIIIVAIIVMLFIAVKVCWLFL